MGYKITIGIGILFIILAFINFAAHLYLLGILLFIGGIVSFSMAGKQNKKRIMVQTQGQEQGQHQIVNVEVRPIVYDSEGKPVERSYYRSPIH